MSKKQIDKARQKLEEEAKAYREWIICPLCKKNGSNIVITALIRDTSITGKELLELQAECKNDFIDINIKYSYYPQILTPVGGKKKIIGPSLFKGH